VLLVRKILIEALIQEAVAPNSVLPAVPDAACES
jgi:hypothetical protein